MKPGKLIVRAILLLLFAAAAAYFGYYAYRIFFGGTNTAIVYSYTSQNTLSAQGYLIRQETVLEDGGSLEEIVVAEGENVAAGDVVARIYRSETALEQRRSLDALETELDRLEYIRSRGAEESDAIRLNQDIIDSITGLKASAARQDLTVLDDQVEELQELIFRRDYAYSNSTSLTEEINRVEGEIQALEDATENAVSTIYSPAAGVFSAMIDGYENAFSLEALEDLTPASLREMASQKAAVSGQELGKVITDFRWYYAAILSQDVTKYLASGDSVTVNFEGSAGSQTMTVQSISSPDEAGEVAVVFVSNRNLSSTTLLREQNVDVAYNTVEGLRIPSRALRANQETGELGVYRISGAQAHWVPVEILYTGSDYYLVRSVEEPSMSELESARQLRPGDEILVGGKNTYDGKVVE